MLDAQKLKEYLLLEKRKKILNWNGIETQYGIDKGRIKNCLYHPDKYHFRLDEIQKLNFLIKDLQPINEIETKKK